MAGAFPRPVRALIVDDEEPVRALVTRVLADAGCDTFVAADGVEAQEIAAAMGRIDLLVTDEVMPGMSGHDLAKWLRKREPQVKVLYFTGFRNRLYEHTHALWAGDAVLDKSCSVEELLETVTRLLFGRITFRPPKPR